jgi:hypothetical protein
MNTVIRIFNVYGRKGAVASLCTARISVPDIADRMRFVLSVYGPHRSTWIHLVRKYPTLFEAQTGITITAETKYRDIYQYMTSFFISP